MEARERDLVHLGAVWRAPLLLDVSRTPPPPRSLHILQQTQHAFCDDALALPRDDDVSLLYGV